MRLKHVVLINGAHKFKFIATFWLMSKELDSCDWLQTAIVRKT